MCLGSWVAVLASCAQACMSACRRLLVADEACALPTYAQQPSVPHHQNLRSLFGHSSDLGLTTQLPCTPTGPLPWPAAPEERGAPQGAGGGRRGSSWCRRSLRCAGWSAPARRPLLQCARCRRWRPACCARWRRPAALHQRHHAGCRWPAPQRRRAAERGQPAAAAQRGRVRRLPLCAHWGRAAALFNGSAGLPG